VGEIVAALDAVPFAAGKPSMIIADTVKGKGVSFMEAGATWHYGALSEKDEARALAEIRGGGKS
jgi:transketolase